MILEFLTLILYSLHNLPLSSSSSSSSSCSKACGEVIYHHLPFPFGFTSGCQIKLNCTSNGTMVIHDFPVQDINQDSIMVNIQAQCGRSIDTIKTLFGSNYAPTSHNGILMQNCTSPLTSCLIPTIMVQTHFELLDCGSKNNSNISCYSEQNKLNQFIVYQNLIKSQCRSFFSSISVESMGDSNSSSSVSLNVQLVQLGWWLTGSCQCSKYADCVKILSPAEDRQGYRCQCSDGFVGDGYRDGSGCRKESNACNPAKYLSGQCGGTTRVGVLIGGVVAGALIMVSLGLICCCIRRRSKDKSRKKAKRELWEATGMNIPVYPYKEIERATQSFSDKRLLGTGAYGAVYSGKLQNDEWVAIKRIKHREINDSIEQVINEIKLISSVNHPNLVRLLGCSIDKSEQILVYEFMPNGTLSQHLQKAKGFVLPWTIRLTIAAETAQAISYLHNAIHPPIYHRDIKSSNILLDNNYNSKLADFGLSRLGMTESSHVSTAPQGTPGYLDPQYHQNFHLSDKSDVYSFGVVLIEIITALKVVDFSRQQNEVNLANLAVDRIGKGCFDELIDPFLEPQNDKWILSSVHKVAELAFRCLAFHRDMRPSMMEIAIELEQIKLSKSSNSEENNVMTGFTASSEVSCSSSSSSCSSSSSSSTSEKPLHITTANKSNSKRMKSYSPVSVQDPWPSDLSSPSSNSFLSNVTR